jgi:hypothetical protein
VAGDVVLFHFKGQTMAAPPQFQVFGPTGAIEIPNGSGSVSLVGATLPATVAWSGEFQWDSVDACWYRRTN